MSGSLLRLALAAAASVAFAGCGAKSGLSNGVTDHPHDGGAPEADTGARDAGSVDAARAVDAGAIEVPTRLRATFRASCLLGEESHCWGASSVTTSFGATPTRTPELDRALDFQMGLTFQCALLANRRVVCAGSNRAGELGLDPAVVERREALELIPGVDRVAELAVGGAHACVLRDDGAILCWGQNSVGAVGRAIARHSPGGSVAEFVPRRVEGLGRAIAVAAGTHHSCAAFDDGTVRCWGIGSYGELGRGSVTPATGDSAPVVGIDDAIDVDAHGNSTCVLRADGTVWCFGRHTEGQLGIADADVEQCVNVVPHPCATSPRRVLGVEHARELDFAGANGCARTDRGGRCWGLIGEAVGGLDLPNDLLEVAVGTQHVCVRQADERVRCIGRGTEGQLGDGATTSAIDWVDTAGF